MSDSLRFLEELDLFSLQHGRTRKGKTIMNTEFIALYLAKHGPTRWKELHSALLRWRGIDRSIQRGHYSIYFHADGMYCKGYRGRTPDEPGKYWWHEDITTGIYDPNVHWFDRHGQQHRGKYIVTYNMEAKRTGFQLTSLGARLAANALARIYG